MDHAEVIRLVRIYGTNPPIPRSDAIAAVQQRIGKEISSIYFELFDAHYEGPSAARAMRRRARSLKRQHERLETERGWELSSRAPQ